MALGNLLFSDGDTDYLAKLNELVVYVQNNSTIVSLAMVGISHQGGWDASGDAYPGAPGEDQSWIITDAGTLGGDAMAVGEFIVYTGAEWVNLNVVTSDIQDDPNPTLGGVLNPNSHAINEGYAAIVSVANVVTIDCAAGNAFSHVLTENTTLAFDNVPADGVGYTCDLEIIQDAGASGFTFTLPASVGTPAEAALVLTATANSVDTVVFKTRDGGVNIQMLIAGQDIK